MPYLVGTDEAGYGPNLGPLIVSATTWRVGSLDDTDLFSRLRGAVRRSPRLRDESADQGVVIGDSKELYKPGQGLSGLEQGVLTCLAAIKKQPQTWKTIWETLAGTSLHSLSELPWYRDFDESLPIDLCPTQLPSRARSFLSGCEQVNCVPLHIESRAVFAKQFNTMIDQYGNKASALSQTTLQLVRATLERLPADEPVYVLCDKHGGRNKYGPLLNDVFPETLAMVCQEGRRESVYRMHVGNQRREIVFRAKGESFLPSALASMVSKYLRELAMLAFNTFWSAHVESFKPTAGYPGDAKRFMQHIDEARKKLGIDETLLWRCR